MNKKLVFVAALLAAGSAAAQTADNGVYVGVEGAYASSSIDNTGLTVTSDKTDAAAVRALIGYQFNKNLGVELGYFATDDFKQSGRLNGTPFSYNAKYDMKGVDLALVYKFTEGLPGFFVKGGVTHSKFSASLNLTGGASGSGSASDSGTGYLFGLGYEYDFAKNWGARLGYTRYEKVGGESDTSLNLFSLGLKYKF